MDVIAVAPTRPEEVDWLLVALALADTPEEQERARRDVERWAGRVTR